MYAQRPVFMLVAALVAVVGTAVLLFNNFSPGDDPRNLANARIITDAAVSRAGAIEIPSQVRPAVSILDAVKAGRVAVAGSG
jgi:hypothetical protein